MTEEGRTVNSMISAHTIRNKPVKFPELYDHQMDALAKMKDGCILWGGVGSGKSRTALAYYALTDAHEDVYVITTAKKRDSLDWEREAVKFAIGKERDATLYGVLTIDSWNNLHKYVNVENAFFIFDEQRLVGKGKWTKWFQKIAKNNRWIMLSATPGDTWMDYVPVFIANGFYRNRTQFKLEHVVYKPYMNYEVVDHYVGIGRLIKHRNAILVHMPYIRETQRHEHTVWVDFNEEDMHRVGVGRWNIYDDEPIRDKAQLFHVMRRVANSDRSRIEALKELSKKHPKLIVFYNFNYELEMLREMGIGLIGTEHERTLAEWNGHNHEEIPSSEAWIYLVQYMAGAEGWNCVSTDAMCFYSLPYSYKLWEQAHGRIDRLNTEFVDLHYYALRSKSGIDHAIWRSLKSKRAFQPDHFDMTNAEFADFSVRKAA
jgi:superfamily II DNA or RNA helicase